MEEWQEYGESVHRMSVPGGWLYRYDPSGSITFVPTAEALSIEDAYALANAIGASIQQVRDAVKGRSA